MVSNKSSEGSHLKKEGIKGCFAFVSNEGSYKNYSGNFLECKAKIDDVNSGGDYLYTIRPK